MPRTPEETFRRLLELMLAKDTDAVAELWAEDGTAEFPFATGSAPRRLAGRDQVRDYLARLPEVMDMREVPAITVHHTHQPDTVVVEFTGTGRTVRTGEPYRLDYIVVTTVQDGLITRYRDYWSPLATASATGTLPELLDSLRSEVTR
ncbi:nuclear transport factor 2 family protein [Amycolatopsis cihanbeyliensis]|uniref:Ketosteroid isomerase-like protein n=1 Tax=Amycolatopsis cihanbeyliensis TaxID=1128664 RepID=A0A542DI30_AMYCI|nr:nuclear transport factor 2 family protein [Amycolatopsis cihanbeyliensis]TQJ02710.1 ketosteroid isomerase-like protein [Amycolatopsis cihanbeyliensis]